VAQLNHPHIIQIYTIGTLPGGRPYLAMPYIEGGTLQDHLTQTGQQKQPLPALRALTLAQQITSALHAAHLAGIIHRDLKPGNIQLQAQPTTIGYTLEAAVPWSELNITPTPGLQIGLALNATDNDTPDTAVQEIFLSNIPNRRLLDPTTWGTLTLQETEP
jgi:serine/threonine protein kinase